MTTSARDDSLAFCRCLTQKTAGNFYFSFLTLPREKRAAMCVVYAWMRLMDDLADDAPNVAEAAQSLEVWRRATHAALAGELPGPTAPHPKLWPAFAEVVRTHGIPHHHFDEIVEGALMDQKILRYATFEELYRYCYRVASVVGLVSLRVFGYSDPRTETCGEWLGIAFQLTNILRDVREDAERGRIYLPLEDLTRHGLAEQDVLRGNWSPAMHDLFRDFADRAEGFYEKAAPVASLVAREARPTLGSMTEIYHGILEEIRAMDYRVLDRRAGLPKWKKLAIVFKHQIRHLVVP